LSDVGAVTKPRRETSSNLLGCLKLANRSQPLVGRISPYCEDVEKILLFNKFFPIVDCLICEDIARQVCAMMRIWRIFVSFLRPVFSASRVQHISDLRYKFALRPHHVWKYGTHRLCMRPLRIGEKRKKKKKQKEETTGVKLNGLPIST